MDLITETYLGWDPLTHTVDCPAPVWDAVEIRRTEGLRPRTAHDEPHACATDGCTHADTFGRVQLRLLCRDCDTVVLVGGEALTETRSNPALTGWGQRPTQCGGVWLWPGRPTIPGGEPHQYLVTLQAAALTRETLYGIITGYHDSTGAQRWIAGCEPDPDGAHQICTLRWRYASNAYESVEDAAEFIDITARFPRQPVVVSV
ncbi:hypothetical protein [Streptomyces sp. DH20]|uniref:hypothetical protein n=1 Tax=Streptomyces sp. DH20 TaxID=2857009 RepID=UPI001E592044|nr:hypothetical protein [Streptomyces sp. DH20]